jgi:hypothetical protein
VLDTVGQKDEAAFIQVKLVVARIPALLF